MTDRSILNPGSGVRPGGSDTSHRYFDLVMVAFVVVLVCSNLIGPAKAATLNLPFIGAVTFGAGVLFFPVSYIFGDILTEVYGYDRARLCSRYGGRCRRLTASALVAQSKSLRDRFRQHLAHCRRFYARLFLRRVRQLVRAGKNESRERGAEHAHALRRVHGGGRGRR